MSKRFKISLLSAAVLAVAAFGLVECVTRVSPPRPGPRPPGWARAIDDPLLPNLHQVDESLYRGAQPDAAGFARLAELGVRTVLNLRSSHDDAEMMGALPLEYERVEMQAYDIDDEEVIAALRVVMDPAKAPVFVHCQHGADRTGLICALYRVLAQGWTREEAIEELKGGGYGFHPIWSNIPRYIEECDVEALRAAIGR